MSSSREIRCSACGREALARGEPVFTGFKKTGEEFVCAACGHRYPSREATPFLHEDSRPKIFSDADKPTPVQIFHSSERRRNCGWCRHFIVNPFRQRCGLFNREVEATDVCERFALKEEIADAGEKNPPEKTAAKNPTSRFDALFKKTEQKP